MKYPLHHELKAWMEDPESWVWVYRASPEKGWQDGGRDNPPNLNEVAHYGLENFRLVHRLWWENRDTPERVRGEHRLRNYDGPYSFETVIGAPIWDHENLEYRVTLAPQTMRIDVDMPACKKADVWQCVVFARSVYTLLDFHDEADAERAAEALRKAVEKAMEGER